MSKDKSIGRYTAPAHCLNCDRTGLVNAVYGTLLHSTFCPHCGIRALETLYFHDQNGYTAWASISLTGWADHFEMMEQDRKGD